MTSIGDGESVTERSVRRVPMTTIESPPNALSGVARVLVNAGKINAKTAEDLIKSAKDRKSTFVSAVVAANALTASDLAKDTPYENRRRTGLPPTPIASPGEAALSAALEPAEGSWLYYVLKDKDGNHLFTDDYQEFLRQKETSQREGIF